MTRSTPKNQRQVEPDPTRADQWVDDPAKVGVLSVRHSVTRSRYYTQPEYSAWIRERLRKILPQFDSYADFVGFATQAAQDRRYPPPNYKASAGMSAREIEVHAWDPARIERALTDLMRGGVALTNTIQFFNAAVDELEGIGRVTRLADSMIQEDGVQVVEETMSLPDDELHVADVPEREFEDELYGLRRAYVELLIRLIEEAPTENLMDRAERILWAPTHG